MGNCPTKLNFAQQHRREHRTTQFASNKANIAGNTTKTARQPKPCHPPSREMSTKDPQQQGRQKVDRPDNHGLNKEREDETRSSAGYEPKPQMEGFGGLKQSEGPKNRKRTTSSQREQTSKDDK